MHMTKTAGTFVLLSIAAILAAFVWLLLHNQSQTEYLTFFDFWRNYNVLAGHGGLDEYLFHDVHTYAVASLVWYLDMWLAGGSLKLLHAIVLGLNAAIALCLAFLGRRLFAVAKVSGAYVLAIVAAALGLWLSPSNSYGLAYPVMDIIASALLLFVCLTAIMVGSSTSVQADAGAQRQRWIGYLCIAVLGFFSLEPFIAVPLFLLVDSALRKRYTEVVGHLLIVAVVLAFYFTLRERPVLQESSPALQWDWLVLAYNVLVFLSMHVLMVLRAVNVSPGLAAGVAVVASTIQLAALILFAVSHYTSAARQDLSPRFALSLAALGILAIILAVWLRNSTAIAAEPVPRYTPYAILFTMGVFFLSLRAILTAGGRMQWTVSFLAVLVTAAYLVTDAWAFLWRSYNPAEVFAQSRLEMPLYAVSPGDEAGLGPSEPDGGLAFRSNLHTFLKTRGLTVFGCPGYLGLGAKLPPLQTSAGARCSLLQRRGAPDQRPGYQLDTFRIEGMPDNGVFLVTDAGGVITAFGFAAKRHPADRTAQSLLPMSDDPRAQVYYAQVRGTDLVSALPCH